MSRGAMALAAVAAAAAAMATLFTWQPGLGSLFDDSVGYLVVAQAIAPFAEAADAVRAAASAEKYPPGAAALVALAGGAFDWRIAHAVVAVAFGASVFALGALTRLATGSTAIALGAALTYALLPGAWLNLKGILSEFPYMALSFGALAAHAALAGGVPTRRAAIIIGALSAAALLTRTIGVALVAAIAVVEAARWMRDRDAARLRAAAWIAFVPLAAAAAWYGLRPSGGEDAYGEYAARVAGEATRGGLEYVGGLVLANAAALRDAWLTALLVFWGEPWKPGFVLAAATGLVGLAGIGLRAWRMHAEALYVLGFLAILLVWPFPGQMFRLALPAIPLVLLGFLWVCHAALASRAGAKRWASTPALVPLAACLPPTLFYIAPRAVSDDAMPSGARLASIAEYYRIPDRRAAEASARSQLGVLEDLARIGTTTPKEARVMWYWPSYVALIAQRRGVWLERPRDGAHLARQARAARADYVYLGELHPRDSAARDGPPLAAFVHAFPLGEMVWNRVSPRGELQGVLLRLDPRKVDAAAGAPGAAPAGTGSGAAPSGTGS